MYYLGDICLSSFTKLIWHTTTSLLANCVPLEIININPLSPNIHIQILQTDLYTCPSWMSWENLIKDESIFPLLIILLILIT